MKKLGKIISVITLFFMSAILIIGCDKKKTTTKKTDKKTVVTTNKTNKTSTKKTTTNNSTTEETKKSYSISLNSEVDGIELGVKYSYNGSRYADIDYNKTYYEGTDLVVIANNTTNKKAIIEVKVGDLTYANIISEGKTNRISDIVLDNNAVITIKECSETNLTKLSLDNDSEVHFSFYYLEDGKKVIMNDDTFVKTGTVIYPSVRSTYEAGIVAYVGVDDLAIDKVKIDGNNEGITKEFNSITTNGTHLYFGYAEDVKCELNFKSEVNGAEFIITNVETNTVVTESGLYFDRLTPFKFAMTNTSGNPVIVNVYTHNTDTDEMELWGSLPLDTSSFEFPQNVSIYTDMLLEIIEYKEYSIKVTNNVGDDVSVDLRYYNRLTSKYTDITPGSYPSNLDIFISSYNYSNNDLIFMLVDTTTKEIIEKAVIKPHTSFYSDYDILLNNIEIIIKEPEENKAISIIDEFDLGINVYAVEGSNKTLITDLTKIKKGTKVDIEFINETDNKYLGILVNNKTLLDSGVINENGTSWITGLVVNDNIVLYTYEYSEINISYTTISGVEISVTDIDGNTLPSGSKVAKYSRLSLVVTNSTDNDVLLVQTAKDQKIGVAVNANDTLDAGYGVLTGDLEISIEEYASYDLTVNLNGYDSDVIVNITGVVNGQIAKLTNGDKLVKYSQALVQITNSSTDSLNLTITNGTTTIYDSSLGKTYISTAPINVTGDLVITVTKASSVNTYTISSNIDVEDLSIDITGDDALYTLGSDIEENSKIVVTITNETETDYIIYAYISGTNTTVCEPVRVNANGTERLEFDIDSNVVLECDIASVNETYTFVNSIVELTVEITVNGEEYDPDADIASGSTINISLKNESESTYTVFVLNEDSDELITPFEIAPGETKSISITLSCNAWMDCEEYEPEDEQYSVECPVSTTGLTFTLLVDDEAIDFGDLIDEGTKVTIEVNNESGADYIIYAYEAGTSNEVCESAIVFDGEDGSLEFDIYCDVTISIELYEEDDEFSLVNDIESDDLEVTITVDGEAYDPSESIEKDTEIVIVVKNNSTEEDHVIYILNADDDNVLDPVTVAAGDEETITFNITCDTYINYDCNEVIPYYFVTVEGSFDDLAIRVTVDDEEIGSTDGLLDEETVVVTVTNSSETKYYTVYAYNAFEDEAIRTITIAPNSSDSFTFDIDASDIDIFSDETDANGYYSFKVEYYVEEEVVLSGSYYDGVLEEDETFLIGEETLPYDTYITLNISNNGTSACKVSVIIHENVVNEVVVDVDGSESLRFTLRGSVTIQIEEYEIDYKRLSVESEYGDDEISFSVYDSDEATYYDGDDISSVNELYLSVTNNSGEDIVVLVVDDDGDYITYGVLEDGKSGNYHIDYCNYGVNVKFLKPAKYLITIEYQDTDFRLEVFDECDKYYNSGDYFKLKDTDIYFEAENMTEDLVCVIDVYCDGEFYDTFEVYPDDYEYWWFGITGDVTFVVRQRNNVGEVD